jgi:hypothetical protein
MENSEMVFVNRFAYRSGDADPARVARTRKAMRHMAKMMPAWVARVSRVLMAG